MKKIKEILTTWKEKIGRVDTTNLTKSAEITVWSFAEQVIAVAIAIIASTFLGLVVYKIIAVGGLPAVIADLMYSTCQTTGIPCEFNSLLGGIGLTLVLLTSFLVATVRIIKTDTDKPELFIHVGDEEPSKYYNHKQVELLRLIQAMNGINNLRKYANLVDVPYTTAQRYVEQFERDGYVSIHSNGQGSQLEIGVIRK